MKDTLEYKILKYLSENDNGKAIEVSHLENDKTSLKIGLSNLKKGKYINSRIFTNENITAKIELKGKKYLSKIDNEFKNITNNFNCSTIGQFNQSEDLNVLKTEIKQTIQPKAKEKQQSAIISFVEKFWWQISIPLLIGIALIFIEKKWNILF